MKNLTLEDVKVLELYKAYQHFNHKRKIFRNFLPTKTDPRKSKYWKYFRDVIRSVQLSTFDPYWFIEAQYRDLPNGKILFPQQLSTKKSVERYLEFRENKKIKEESTQNDSIIKMQNIAATFKLIKRWWKRNNKKMYDYESFFRPRDHELYGAGVLYALQNMLSKYFLSVSKTFIKYYKKMDNDEREEIITLEEFKKYRGSLILDKEAYIFTKEVFGSKEII